MPEKRTSLRAKELAEKLSVFLDDHEANEAIAMVALGLELGRRLGDRSPNVACVKNGLAVIFNQVASRAGEALVERESRGLPSRPRATSFD
jgi:hypothetical protein